MRKTHGWTVMLVTSAVMLVVVGCTTRQVPKDVGHAPSEQRIMQTAYHWDVLASQVADEVRRAIDDRVELKLLPIDVHGYGTGPFPEVYSNLLRSQLVQRGLQVPADDEGLLQLEFEAQTIATGEHAGVLEREVVVTNRLIWKNRSVMQMSSVYYINAGDFEDYDEYIDNAGYDVGPKAFEPRVVEVRND